MTLSRNKLSRLIIILIACCGLIFQIINISDRYFQFKTRTIIGITNPLHINIPTLSTCWDSEDVLEISEIEEKLNISFPSTEQIKKNLTLYWNAAENLNASDYFDFTPSNESILENDTGCSIRYPGRVSPQYPYPPSKECYERFNISKFLHRGMMCYSFSLKIPPKTRLEAEEYSLAPESSGMIFKLFFDKKIFGDVGFYSAFLHGSTTSKLLDSMFSPKRYFFLIPNSTNNYMNADVTYSSVTATKLPPPYDTRCRDIPGYKAEAEYYFAQLREKLIEEINFVDTFAPIYDRIQYPLLSPHGFAGGTLQKKFDKIRNSTHHVQSVCKSHYYVSRSTIGASDQLYVGVFWPEDTTVVLEYAVEQETIDYIVLHLFSCRYLAGIIILFFDRCC